MWVKVHPMSQKWETILKTVTAVSIQQLMSNQRQPLPNGGFTS
jgi:hypothetical protein